MRTTPPAPRDPELTRRSWLGCAALAAGALAGAPALRAARAPLAAAKPDLHLAPFRLDVTPPRGHSLCGGWIRPVESVDDPLEALGFVLLGHGDPIVVCAVDWTGLLNGAHVAWRRAIAEAVGTTPERVAVQCVHQHNAPFACTDSEEIVLAQGDLPSIVDLDFFRRTLDSLRTAVARAVPRARSVTHIASGSARVEKVASNRRVNRDANGRVISMRGSSCRDEALRALPDGEIDPWLRTVAFFDGSTKIAACHYYATHPMSYYGDGRVSSDFAGLARKSRQADEPDVHHVYFTGCAGNIAAGKYNDGSRPLRRDLALRVYDGIVRSEADLAPSSIETVEWRTTAILPAPRDTPTPEELERQIADHSAKVVDRNRPSYELAYHRRFAAKTPIVLSALHLGDVRLLHLPAECFVGYQLRAQRMGGDGFVATAAYGDGGPWYIPTADEYDAGGYEVSVAFCAPAVDRLLDEGMRRLLG